MKKRLHFRFVGLMAALLLGVTSIIAQTSVSGTVTSAADGEGLPGVSISVENTSRGTITDMNGNYTIQLREGDEVLEFSYIGFVAQTVPIAGRSTIDVQLEEDVEQLEEVVVVGYGTLQERDLTSAISTVDSDEIIKTPTNNPMQALQGRVAGLQVVSNGAPGGSPTVRIRGIGSFQGNAQPLFVVDGMFFDNIDFLNPADIETISVLKDASAAAIYGVRAGNGVVLIETKGGNYGQSEIVYNGYVGVQNPQNVIQMSNAEQFVQYVNETGAAADASFVDMAMQRYGRSEINPNVPAVNTDWYDLVMDPASIQNHTLSFNGGSERTRYSIGGSYLNQQGLLSDTRNEYKRMNFRAKIDSDIKDWLTVGGNLNVSMARRYDGSNAAWFNAYFAVPIMPQFDDQNVDASPFQLANAQQIGYRGTQNPFFPLFYNDNRNNIGKVLGNFYAELDIIPDHLTFRTAYNYSLGQVNVRNVDFAYNTGITEIQSAIGRSNTTSFDQIWDNFLTYRNNWGRHNLNVVAGYSYRSEYREFLTARGTDINPPPQFGQEYLWYITRGGADGIDINSVNDDPGINGSLFFQSYFGRIAYNYDDRYLFYTTYRADGNNKFQEKWGNFATVGAGWVLSEEEFFDVDAINFLKFRVSWGQMGNDGIRPATGAPTFDVGRLTVINGAPVQGRVVDPFFDLIDRWETTTETNFGLTARFLDNRLDITADYYIRDTEDLAVTILLPLVRSQVQRSTGEIRNQGFEFSLNWTDEIGDLTYNIGGNFATLQNEVRSLGGAQYLDAGSAEFRQRSIIGEPYQAFFGYEVNGVFQSEADINNSGYTQEFINDTGLEPGDFFFKDQNGDGVVNDEDRVVLGSYLPDLTYGFNIGLSYRNWDFSAFFQGQSGHQILNRKRGEIIFTNDTNLDAELVNNLWRGAGTSNRYPSAAGLRKGWNQNMSDYYVEDGSYFRIQNVRLAYRIVGKEVGGTAIPETQIILTAERPLTVFDYNGFNPEVANGIDRQVYPIPAVYTVGLNVRL